MIYYINSDSLSHHGIKNQKWGKRNGPPYPLKGGDYSPAEKQAIYTERRKKKNSIYNKKHFDDVVKKGDEITTYSYRPNRTQGAKLLFAIHDKMDEHTYNAFFNKPIKDAAGNKVLKYKIKNTATKNIDVASEDSAGKMFLDLYKNDRDFYNYVTDKNRMRKMLAAQKHRKVKGFQEGVESLEKLDKGEKLTEEDVRKAYRIFNYIMTAHGDKDLHNQRDKFFNKAKEEGYEAFLDINDGVYGGFKTRTPMIIIDPTSFALKSVERTTMKSKRVSMLIAIGRRALRL